MAYTLLKFYVKAGLHLYYGKIENIGLHQIPSEGPVLFLPNHQAALIDVLLIVTHCRRKPYFLTRADIFQNSRLLRFFRFLQMLPVYRIRDGRDALKNNQRIFKRCAELLQNDQALVIFPEGNHNLERRVRPLSKGFTRVLDTLTKRQTKEKIAIIPVGMNYSTHTGFPDRVAVHYDTPKVSFLPSKISEKAEAAENNRLKQYVSERLKTLTTHISERAHYNSVARRLHLAKPDYLKPAQTNVLVKKLEKGLKQDVVKPEHTIEHQFSKQLKRSNLFVRLIFVILNYPLLYLWKKCIRPKVKEPEFTATFRFLFALVAYPIYYSILFFIITWGFAIFAALLTISTIFLYNLLYVKLYRPTTYYRQKKQRS